MGGEYEKMQDRIVAVSTNYIREMVPQDVLKSLLMILSRTICLFPLEKKRTVSEVFVAS